MNIFGVLDASVLWFYGVFIIILTIKHWNHPGKDIKIKLSEFIYGGAYIINGFIVLNLFTNENISIENETFLHAILFIIFIGILIWLWGTNVLYTMIRLKKHPELMSLDAPLLRHSDPYWNKLDKEYEHKESKDVVKDLSRKLLHFIVLGIVVGFHELTNRYPDQIIASGYTPMAIRNFLYMGIAFIFLLMFTTADMVRVYKFEYLPDWALKWYGKSVEPSTEKYTYVSSVPMLLALMVFAQAPFYILMCGAMVSCVSDAVASVVGKNFGRHKMKNFGRYPHKSYEGIFGGATTAFLGVFMVFEFYPVPGASIIWRIVFGLIAGLIFVYIDAFSQYLVDNLLNVLLPALSIWLIIVLFL